MGKTPILPSEYQSNILQNAMLNTKFDAVNKKSKQCLSLLNLFSLFQSKEHKKPIIESNKRIITQLPHHSSN